MNFVLECVRIMYHWVYIRNLNCSKQLANSSMIIYCMHFYTNSWRQSYYTVYLLDGGSFRFDQCYLMFITDKITCSVWVYSILPRCNIAANISNIESFSSCENLSTSKHCIDLIKSWTSDLPSICQLSNYNKKNKNKPSRAAHGKTV